MQEIIEYLSGKKIIIVCGHYGAGKTNISVNLAIELKKQTGLVYTLVDLDMVNPYFRSADNAKDLKEHGVDIIVPPFANTNVDVPAIPPEIYSIFADNANNANNQEKRAIIDVGGDDNGALVLGMFADNIKRENHGNYEMIYVVNKYRNMTGGADQAVKLAESIENKSKLKITSVINNSNIGSLTTGKEIINSMEYAQKTADSLNVRLLGTTSVIDTAGINIDVDFSDEIVYNIFKIKNYTRKLF